MVAETFIKYFQKKKLINSFKLVVFRIWISKISSKRKSKGLAKDNYGKPKLDASNFLKYKRDFPYIILRLYQVYDLIKI